MWVNGNMMRRKGVKRGEEMRVLCKGESFCLWSFSLSPADVDLVKPEVFLKATLFVKPV